MSPALLIGLAILTPLAGALAVAISGRNNDGGDNVRDGVTVVATLLTFAWVVQLLPLVLDGGRPRLELFEVLAGVPIAFEVEPLGMLFGLVASGLWIPTSIYAFGYMRGHHEKHQTRFFICFAVAIFAALLIAGTIPAIRAAARHFKEA